MRLARLLAVGIIVLLACGSAYAAPMYLTFSGKLDYAYDFTLGNYVSSLGGYTVGSSTLVTTFVLDTSVTNVSYQYYGSINGPFGPPYFSSQVYSGDALPVTGTTTATASNVTFAYDYGSYWFAYGSKFPGLNPNWVYLYSAFPIASLAVGQTGFFYQSYADDTYGVGASGLYGYTYGYNFALIRIADTPPDAVPEPATLLLVGSGLVGLSIRRRRR